jgi:hypothetical protein
LVWLIPNCLFWGLVNHEFLKKRPI